MGDKQPINTGKMTITGIRGKKRGKLEERKQVKRGKRMYLHIFSDGKDHIT